MKFFVEEVYEWHMNNINRHVETLHDCMVACNHCYDVWLKEENDNMMADCIRLDRETDI